MKTLLERLKPQYLQLLESDAEKFPYLVLGIKKELQENNNLHTITFLTAHQLSICCKVTFGIGEINGLFLKD
jgi:hypothetical protein